MEKDKFITYLRFAMIDMAMARSLDCTFECFFCDTKHFFKLSYLFLRIYQVATFFQSSYSFYLKLELPAFIHLSLDLTPSSACSALESLLQGKSKEFLRNILRYSAYWEQSFWAESWLIPMLLPEDGRRGRQSSAHRSATNWDFPLPHSEIFFKNLFQKSSCMEGEVIF